MENSYRDLSDPWDTWASTPGSPVDELRVAHAAVPNRCRDISIRVMNVAGYPVTLHAGVVLADLEAVKIVGDKDLACDDTAPRNGSRGHDGTDSEYVSELLGGVDSSVPDTATEALGELLRHVPAVFSRGESDLGASQNRYRFEYAVQTSIEEAPHGHGGLN